MECIGTLLSYDGQSSRSVSCLSTSFISFAKSKGKHHVKEEEKGAKHGSCIGPETLVWDWHFVRPIWLN